MAGKKKSPHIKTDKAEVSIKLRGRAIQISILLRPDLAKQLAFRLASPKRFPNPRKK